MQRSLVGVVFFVLVIQATAAVSESDSGSKKVQPCPRPFCVACEPNTVQLPSVTANNCPWCPVCIPCPAIRCAGCPKGAKTIDLVDRNGCSACPACQTDKCPLRKCEAVDCPESEVIQTIAEDRCPGCPTCSCVKPTCIRQVCPKGTVEEPQIDSDGCAACPKCVELQ